ncbi:MAG: hypothetical protein HC929_22395 [Leptolyngbyaceae cyanobacterium SM2_5_2]|nr:hypothetical protein [Leptolyngbyaceae cyanobacterium SM2_5_2]
MPEAGVPAAIAADPSQPTQGIIAVEPVDASVNASPDTSDNVQADALLLPSSSNSLDRLQIAAPLANGSLLQTPLAQPLNMAQTTAEPSPSEQWHFLLVPYIYVPFNISGSATFKGTEEFRNNFLGDFDDPSRDFEFTPTEIRTALQNSLNFAFLGGLEAWTPNYTVGILANLDYVSLSSRETLNRDVRIPGAAAFVPTEVNAALNTQLWRGDLAASYRFYDAARANPEGLNTEFDLGPFVFDVLGGLSLVQINTQLGLNTNLGGSGQFNSTRTVISPLIGGRVRWNANPKLAVLASGTVSGFGLSGLTQYGIQGGVDWMFSGDTTLGAGYRFGFLDYSSDQIDLNVNQNGPYLNIGFRF